MITPYLRFDDLPETDRPVIRLVAFDVNGTLLDDTPILVSALNAVFVSLGRPALSRAEIARRLGLPWTALYRRAGVDPAEVSDQELGRLYREAYAAGPAPSLSRGAEAAVRTLRRRAVPVAVLSAQEEAMTRGQLAAWPALLAGLSEVRGDVADKAAALRDLARRHGLRTAEIAYVGDQASDMAAARAAGVVGIGRLGGVAPAWRLRRAGARVLVCDLAEIPNLIVR